MTEYHAKSSLLQRIYGYFLSCRFAWQMTSPKQDQWTRHSWWVVYQRHHWWLKLLGRKVERPTEHAPWLNAEAIAYRRAMGREEPFLG